MASCTALNALVLQLTRVDANVVPHGFAQVIYESL